MLEILIASDNNRPLAALLAINFKNTKYDMYNGADYNFLQKSPNHLLLWTSIKNAYNQGHLCMNEAINCAKNYQT